MSIEQCQQKLNFWISVTHSTDRPTEWLLIKAILCGWARRGERLVPIDLKHEKKIVSNFRCRITRHDDTHAHVGIHSTYALTHHGLDPIRNCKFLCLLFESKFIPEYCLRSLANVNGCKLAFSIWRHFPHFHPIELRQGQLRKSISFHFVVCLFLHTHKKQIVENCSIAVD